MKTLKTLSIIFIAMLVLSACSNEKKQDDFDPATAKIGGERELELTLPPHVPPPVEKDRPAMKLIVNMEVTEEKGPIADGVEYTFWTFGGSVPGKFIRAREGDMIEFHLKNHPDSKFAHNIDLHAVNGPGGGAEASFTAPGHETVFSFRLLNPGLYVYHCATAPVGMHIANGMYGLILVEPKEGLPKVDKEYYVMQGDFYTKGDFGDGGHQPFDMNKALDENAEYVVFNGSVGALTGDNALTAEVGETVRLYVGNGGPNLVSSFHVIGEIFDKVNVEGGDLINTNVQSTLIPAGGSAIVEFKVEVPGTFILVDHSIFRAFNKGALGELKVNGKEDEELYSGKQEEKVYMLEGGVAQNLPEEEEVEKPPLELREQIEEGARIYKQFCQACHQPNGKGVPGVFPPVVESDYIAGDASKVIGPIVNGLSGKITVNGTDYNSAMPKQQLTDKEVANVATYVMNELNNGGGEVTIDMVKKERK